jgi:ribosomal protein S18 acetylase RimI-like enzyme
MPAGAELQRIQSFQARLDERTVDRVDSWDYGTELFSPTVAQVRDANYCRLDRHGAAAGEIAEAAASACEAAGLRHVSVVVADEAEAERLRDDLARLGFEVVRHVAMILRDAPPSPDTPVSEVSAEDASDAIRYLRADEEPDPADLAAELAEVSRRIHEAAGGRWFAVHEDGRIAARAWLLADAGVAQVEDVATAPAARGRGLARAAVSAATQAALESGAELVFVVADADETTPELYRKLGFEPLGITTRFIRKPAE